MYTYWYLYVYAYDHVKHIINAVNAHRSIRIYFVVNYDDEYLIKLANDSWVIKTRKWEEEDQNASGFSNTNGKGEKCVSFSPFH